MSPSAWESWKPKSKQQSALLDYLRLLFKSTNKANRPIFDAVIDRLLDTRSFEGTMPELPGEIAVAYGADAIAPARGVYEFEKKNKDAVKIVGGIFEGKYADAAFMMTLATIPGREVLLGKFVNLINSPLQRLVMALDQISKTKQA
jgi:large subunit ribosomal protein L10